MTANSFDELRNIVNHEMPTFMATSYGHVAPQVWPHQADGIVRAWPINDRAEQFIAAAQKIANPDKRNPILIAAVQSQPETPVMTNERRMVRVLVVDPDEAVPTADALLFDSKEMFTDKTDQELFFEIGVGAFLATHNAKRVKIVDKTIKDRTQFLEPARIRDLKMLVITLAKF